MTTDFPKMSMLYIHHDVAPGYEQWHVKIRLPEEDLVLQRFAHKASAEDYVKYTVHLWQTVEALA